MRSELEYSPTARQSLNGWNQYVVVGPFDYGLQYRSQVIVYHPFLRFFLAIKFNLQQTNKFELNDRP